MPDDSTIDFSFSAIRAKRNNHRVSVDSFPEQSPGTQLRPDLQVSHRLAPLGQCAYTFAIFCVSTAHKAPPQHGCLHMLDGTAGGARRLVAGNVC
jgi:hypothetical protein